jgi:hypothetical protein
MLIVIAIIFIVVPITSALINYNINHKISDLLNIKFNVYMTDEINTEVLFGYANLTLQSIKNGKYDTSN